jgi:hypothetical protein
MHSRVRRFSRLAAVVVALLAGATAVDAQQPSPAPSLWFQGAHLRFDRAVPTGGDLAVSTHDPARR